ncbi:MAG: ABC transporter substrate-binding protein [Planctomycetaceae bacterium]
MLVQSCLGGTAAWLFGGCGRPPAPAELTDSTNWDEILELARGSTVRLSMWDGDPLINAYMRDYVTPHLRDDHGIDLELTGGQGNAIVSRLLVDLEGGRRTGDLDLVWINGETFYQLRKINGLYGPFTQRLPNNRFVDWNSPFIGKDFQQPVAGYECPWGSVQLAIIYNSEAVPEPPRDMPALAAWVCAHPGRFTIDNSFTGMTFLKSLLYEFAGGPTSLDGPYDAAQYAVASARLWDWLGGLLPFLWRRGETFPESVTQLHQLFANREVDFTMSNNDGEVDNKVLQGVLPESSRAYVLDTGTIRNSHYLGIPVNAPNRSGALVAANFLISPDAQLQKANPAVWGDGTVLSLDRLPAEFRPRFANISGRTRIAPRAELEVKALPEPAAEVMVRLHADFRSRIIEHAA